MCWTPMNVLDANKQVVQVPCGKCEKCVKRKISAWSFRLMNEDRYSTSAHFITLTYDRKHCPTSKNGFMSLEPKHLQDYFKRLRTDTDRRPSLYRVNNRGLLYNPVELPIKYYAVGEYGTKSGRPHYHYIGFNIDITLIANAWRCTSEECGCGKLIGEVHYGTVSGASVGYTLKYISKRWHPKHSNDDRQPQFARMSKKIGINYLTPAVIGYHKHDLYKNMHLTTDQGIKLAMPRYYKDKIYSSEEKGLIKGYFEQKMLDQDYENYQKNAGKHSPGYVEGVKASYRRMYYSSTLMETL